MTLLGLGVCAPLGVDDGVAVTTTPSLPDPLAVRTNTRMVPLVGSVMRLFGSMTVSERTGCVDDFMLSQVTVTFTRL